MKTYNQQNLPPPLDRSRGFHPDRYHVHSRGWQVGIHDKNSEQIVCTTRKAEYLASNFASAPTTGENFALASAVDAKPTYAVVVQLEG